MEKISLDSDIKKLIKKIDEIIIKSSSDIVLNYEDTLKNIKFLIANLFEKYEIDGKLTLNELNRYDRIKKLDEEIRKQLSELYLKNKNKTNKTLKDIFILTNQETIDMMQKHIKKSLISIKKSLNLQIDKTVNEQMAGLNWANRYNKHRADIIYNINSVLKSNLAKGSTYRQMAKALDEKLRGDVVKPLRIIRTEGARVYASTQKQGLDKIAQKGVYMTKTWISVRDERVRNFHKKMDNVTVKYEDDFILPDNIKTKAPHLTGYAHHDIHCRCIMIIDLIKEDEKIENKANYFENLDEETKQKYYIQEIKNKNYTSDEKQYIRYKEVLKQKAPNSLDKFQTIKYNYNKEYEKLKLSYKDEKLKAQIRRVFNLKIHQGQQDKHIKGSNNYKQELEKGRLKSYLLDNIDPQELVNIYAGTGEIRRYKGKWIGKQFFEHTDYIGYVYTDGQWIKTKYFSIHYSKKKGTHIVPRLKE